MQPLRWDYRPDGLRAPALICGFKGWNDASDAASTALTFVGGALGARRFATIDPEEFYDFQATRPRVTLVNGDTREIVWPAVELFEARVPRAPRWIQRLGLEWAYRLYREPGRLARRYLDNALFALRMIVRDAAGYRRRRPVGRQPASS